MYNQISIKVPFRGNKYIIRYYDKNKFNADTQGK